MITASIVLYRTQHKDLFKVLSSAIKSNIDKIYVVDNSPTDELKSYIQTLGYAPGRVEYFYGQGNVGFGKGNNIAIKKAFNLNSKYHIVLNPDIIFEPDVIDKLAAYMDRNPDIGQILPKVIYPDGRLQHLCKLLPTPYDIFARRFLPKRLFKKHNDTYEMRFMGYDRICDCPILSGCFMFLRTDIIKEVGLFDPRFFMYFEDFDLMRRIHAKTNTIFYPYTTIIHNHAAEHRHNSFLLKQSLISAIKYFNKWGWFFDKERKAINKSVKKFL